jgi:hypothetical protein
MPQADELRMIERIASSLARQGTVHISTSSIVTISMLNPESAINAGTSPQDTYVKLLLPYHHGYPLWVPEPDENLPEAYRNRGVSIGDLGYISESGGFEYLFNVLESTEDEVNVDRTPDDFTPLALNTRTDIATRSQMYKPNTDISSVQMKKTRVSQEDVGVAP